MVSRLKSSVSGETSMEGGRKLPQVEKLSRLRDQQQRLPGIAVKGELQPSFALVDMVASMAEAGTLTWIPPSMCSKRDSEVQQNIREKSPIITVEQQTLKVAAPDLKVATDTSTSLQVQWALQRRGLAFDQCNIISFTVHESGSSFW